MPKSIRKSRSNKSRLQSKSSASTNPSSSTKKASSSLATDDTWRHKVLASKVCLSLKWISTQNALLHTYSIDYHSVNKKGSQKGGFSYNSEKFGGTGGRIFNDDKTPEEALQFYRDILTQLHTFSTDDANIYWWYASRLTDINMQAMKETGWHYSQTIIWLKNSLIFSPGQKFHRIYEPCLMGWKQGQTSYQNRTFSAYTELWTTGDQKTFAEYLDVWYQKRDPTALYIHPTQKPVQLSERGIKRSSEVGDIVLDAFGGSGSTLIGCDQLGRRARLIELDPKYVDAIVGRYCKFKEDTTIIKNGQETQWVA